MKSGCKKGEKEKTVTETQKKYHCLYKKTAVFFICLTEYLQPHSLHR